MTDEASTTTWETLVEHYKELAARADDRIDELTQRANHWHDTAQMLKRQRDMAEEERDGWKIRAMQSEQQRQSLRDQLILAEGQRDQAKASVEDIVNNWQRTYDHDCKKLTQRAEAAEAECEALLSVIERVRPSIHLDAALAVQPTTSTGDPK